MLVFDGLCESRPGHMKSKGFQGKIQLDAWWPNFPNIGNGIIFPDVIFHMVIFLLQSFLLQSHQYLFLLTGDRKCHFYYSKALQLLLLCGSISNMRRGSPTPQNENSHTWIIFLATWYQIISNASLTSKCPNCISNNDVVFKNRKYYEWFIWVQYWRQP